MTIQDADCSHKVPGSAGTHTPLCASKVLVSELSASVCLCVSVLLLWKLLLLECYEQTQVLHSTYSLHVVVLCLVNFAVSSLGVAIRG